jgi:hypothetical protein
VQGLDRREREARCGEETGRKEHQQTAPSASSSVLLASSGAEIAEGGGELKGLPAVRDRVYVAVEFDVQGLYCNEQG